MSQQQEEEQTFGQKIAAAYMKDYRYNQDHNREPGMPDCPPDCPMPCPNRFGGPLYNQLKAEGKILTMFRPDDEYKPKCVDFQTLYPSVQMDSDKDDWVIEPDVEEQEDDDDDDDDDGESESE